jgi:RNA polymerase sigma factor (sigma-70 family)
VLTDFELLDAWIAGDRAAARVLFDRHMHSLYRFFRDKLDGGVEDAVQDTLVACVAGRERFRGESSFRTYMFGTARHILWQQFEKRKRAPIEFDPERSSLHELGPSPSSVAAHKAEHRLLLEGLRRLPIDSQVLLELYHFEELTALDLAAMYGLTEVAVRGRLHRAKARLREEMEKLSDSSELVESTWTNLEAWAKQLRDPQAS